MLTSADIVLLIKVAELAGRYGMRPSEADASFGLVQDEDGRGFHYELDFTGITNEKQENFERMAKALGANENGIVITNELSEMEDIVEQALSVAPRARSR